MTGSMAAHNRSADFVQTNEAPARRLIKVSAAKRARSGRIGSLPALLADLHPQQLARARVIADPRLLGRVSRELAQAHAEDGKPRIRLHVIAADVRELA